jgi:hypothetical protein
MNKILLEDVMTDLEMISATAEIIKHLVGSAETGSGDSRAMALDSITGHAAKRISEITGKVIEKLQPERG